MPDGVDIEAAQKWIKGHAGVRGEESLELLSRFGIHVAPSDVAKNGKEVLALADTIGYPEVLKVV